MPLDRSVVLEPGIVLSDFQAESNFVPSRWQCKTHSEIWLSKTHCNNMQGMTSECQPSIASRCDPVSSPYPKMATCLKGWCSTPPVLRHCMSSPLMCLVKSLALLFVAPVIQIFKRSWHPKLSGPERGMWWELLFEWPGSRGSSWSFWSFWIENFDKRSHRRLWFLSVCELRT